MKRHGFTLIELLIVVAIIAILAAIAVPNFLEAQVRSKVSRVKSDMRTLATSCEAYKVDTGKYPIGANMCWNLPPMSDVGLQWSFWTTPVAYITSIPEDPFAATGKLAGKGVSGSGTVILGMDKRYQYNVASPETWIHTVTYSCGGAAYQQMQKVGIEWFLMSWGPSRRQYSPDGTVQNAIMNVAMATPPYPNMYYDPSNGTMSFGWIFRSNRGAEPAGGK
mgnify:CR=1 FL=1